MTETLGSAINWFDIPVSDLDRATKFYSEILGATLERYRGVGIEGALFPCGSTAWDTAHPRYGLQPTHQGSVVYLNGGNDLNTILNRVEGRGEKTGIGVGRVSPTLRPQKATASDCHHSVRSFISFGTIRQKEQKMTQPVSNRINWFEIPVTDMDRAAKFYSEIFETALESGPGVEGFVMTMFPQTDGVNGALVQGETYVPSLQGAVVYLNGGEDLTTILNRVEGAGGKALSEKIDIGDGNGFCAYFEDTEGNRVGLHSMG